MNGTKIEGNIVVHEWQETFIRKTVVGMGITSRWAREMIQKTLNFCEVNCKLVNGTATDVHIKAPMDLKEPVRHFLQKEMRRIPKDKIEEVMKIIRTNMYADVILQILSDSGATVLDDVVISKEKNLPLFMKDLVQDPEVPSYIRDGIQCLAESDACLFVQNGNASICRFPSFFPREVLERASMHFQKASGPDEIYYLEKHGFNWKNIRLFLCLYEGNINGCASTEEYVDGELAAQSGTPLLSNVYVQKKLLRESASMFNVSSDDAEAVAVPLATAESFMSDPEFIEKFREFIDSCAFFEVFTDDKNSAAAEMAMAKSARENEDAHDAVYEHKKKLEELSVYLFKKIDAIALPAFSEAHPDDTLQSDATKNDMRRFLQYVFHLDNVFQNFLEDLQRESRGMQNSALAQCITSIISANLLSYIQKRFPAVVCNLPNLMEDEKKNEYKVAKRGLHNSLNSLEWLILELRDLQKKTTALKSDISVPGRWIAKQSVDYHATVLQGSLISFYNLHNAGQALNISLERERAPVDIRTPFPRFTLNRAYYDEEKIVQMNHLQHDGYTECIHDLFSSMHCMLALQRFDSDPCLHPQIVIPLSNILQPNLRSVQLAHYLACHADKDKQMFLDCVEDTGLLPYAGHMSHEEMNLHMLGSKKHGKWKAGLFVDGKISDEHSGDPLPDNLFDVTFFLKGNQVHFEMKNPTYFSWDDMQSSQTNDTLETNHIMDPAKRKAVKAFLHSKKIWTIKEAVEILGWAGIAIDKKRGGSHWKMRGVDDATLATHSAPLKDGEIYGHTLEEYIMEIGDEDSLYDLLPDKFKES